MRQPIQPLYYDDHSVIRFHQNEIVRQLLDKGGIDLNHIARWDVSREDRVQFAQLIGYSLGGFGELSYVNDDDYAIAETMFGHDETEQEAEIRHLRSLVATFRTWLKGIVPQLFPIHPDDLND